MGLAFWGRIISGLCVIAFPIVAVFYNLTVSMGLNIFCIFISVFIGIIELPLLCTCFEWCKCVALYMKYITGWWAVRGILYLGLSAAAYAIYVIQTPNQPMLGPLIGLDVSAVFFIIAAIRQEPNPAYELVNGGKTPDATPAVSKSSGGGSWFSRKSTAAASTAGAAAGAAAGASAAKTIFGGKDAEAAAVAPAAASSGGGGLFSGGGLFGGGGGASKYGFSQGTPEANPFMK